MDSGVRRNDDVGNAAFFAFQPQFYTAYRISLVLALVSI
jgi:hypothetical protein